MRFIRIFLTTKRTDVEMNNIETKKNMYYSHLTKRTAPRDGSTE